MERYVYLFKKHVVNFKLELCCFMATVRSGLLAFAGIHIAIGVLSLMFFAEDSFQPLLLRVLKGISSDPPNYEASCIIAYSIELGSNVVLLCATMRNDLVLLRVFLCYALAVLTAALMVYTVTFIAQEFINKLLIVISISHQIYIILLVRSNMIDIKLASKRNSYGINYRNSSIRYSRPSSRDRYSVVIEPYSYRPRNSLVPLVVRETNITKTEESDAQVNEVTVITHSPAKEAVTTEATAKEERTAEARELTMEVKGKDVKRKRSFFGRKEKVKNDARQETKEA